MSRHWNVRADCLFESALMGSQLDDHLSVGGARPEGGRAAGYRPFMAGSTQNLTNSPTSLMSLVSFSLPSALGTSHCHLASGSSFLGTRDLSFSSGLTTGRSEALPLA